MRPGTSMICNRRQAAVSRRRHAELLAAARQLPEGQRDSHLAMASEIGDELAEYEAITSGRRTWFEVADIDSLGEALIKARLARGWTQRQLAEKLDVSEQMVQKDEARQYEHAGLARIAEIADVLGFALTGQFWPVGE